MSHNGENTKPEAVTEAETAAEQETAQQQEPEQRTFSQDEVNAIVQKRLERERERSNSLLGSGEAFRDELLKREKAVTEREFRATARERLSNEQLPVEAAELLKFDDEKSFEASYKLLAEVLKSIRDSSTKKAVESIFKQHGRNPKGGGSTGRDVDDELKAAFAPHN